MKTFVLGDIHGGHKALLQCLERSGFNKEEDTLIFLGDVADGWSQTAECVKELLSVKNLIAITGNHDKWAYDWLKYSIAPPMWLKQGGQATFNSYAIYNPDLMVKHEQQYFAKTHLYYIDDKNRAFVHGGYSNMKGLGHDVGGVYYWDRDLWQTAMSGHNSQKLPKLLKPHEEIFIGHTSTMYWKKDKPMHKCNVWNLDTGGGYAGKLTIMDVDTKEYWQSDNLKKLYKDEKGR